MLTLGIDLSSSKEGTAACLIQWNGSRAVMRKLDLRCDDIKLDELIGEADVVGIDAPFGWPVAFIDAVVGWSSTVWTADERRRLQFRITDLYVREKLGIWPLSVSTDRIALPAMRANALLQRHDVKDRSGDGKFYEVYPAATLKSWDLPCRGYKLIDPNCARVRKNILSGLRKKLPYLEVANECAENSDALDALIASVTARFASQGLTYPPSEAGIARREGWIHFPKNGD